MSSIPTGTSQPQVNNALLDIFGGNQQQNYTTTQNTSTGQELFSMNGQHQNFVPLYEDSNVNIELIMSRNPQNF